MIFIWVIFSFDVFISSSHLFISLEEGNLFKEVLKQLAKLSKPLVKELTEMAENIGSEVKVISTETPEGEQFYNMGGIGSILRFKI